jgi:hypothetical protein
MARPAPSRRLRDALALLRDALPPTSQVILRPSPGSPPALVLTPPNGKRSTLHLVDPDAPPRATTVARASWAWLVTRGTVAQRQRWREHDENFIDLSGAVRLRVPGIFIDRTDLAATRRSAMTSRTSHTRNPFGDRASLVVRVLLEDPARTWTTSALAEEAGVSIATVSLVTEALNNADLVRIRRVGRARAIAINHPEAVLTQWARRYDWTRNTAISFAAPVGAPERFLRRLPDVLGRPTSTGLARPTRTAGHRRWALTLQAGASLFAPHAQWDTIHLYVDADEADELLDIGERAGWQPSATGRVVLFLPYYRTSVWHRASVRQDLPVVSPTQLILDLWNYPVRGREQAEHLMRTAGGRDSDG